MNMNYPTIDGKQDIYKRIKIKINVLQYGTKQRKNYPITQK